MKTPISSLRSFVYQLLVLVGSSTLDHRERFQGLQSVFLGVRFFVLTHTEKNSIAYEETYSFPAIGGPILNAMRFYAVI